MAFGEIPGVPPQTHFDDYAGLVEAQVHRQYNAGMVGGRGGTESVVLNGGYDDQDFGHEVIYTGFGGQDQSGKQIADQQWIKANEGMRANVSSGELVRVIRGYKGERAFSPSAGYRYDGLYVVEETWQEPGADGFQRCRFRLVKTDDTPLPPQTSPPPQPIKRVAVTTLRRVRDTAMTKRIKELYDYTCQICGLRLTLPGGFGYAEGAHIRPLGSPHDGDDTEDNVLCLCPNHHVLFDRGGLWLSDGSEVVDSNSQKVVGTLHLAKDHSPSTSNITFHRSLFAP